MVYKPFETNQNRIDAIVSVYAVIYLTHEYSYSSENHYEVRIHNLQNNSWQYNRQHISLALRGQWTRYSMHGAAVSSTETLH